MLVPTRCKGVRSLSMQKGNEGIMEQERSAQDLRGGLRGQGGNGKGKEVRVPVYSTRVTSPGNGLFLTIPPLISGALISAFARHITSLLGDPLFTNFYLANQRVAINIDRVLDRLITTFTRELWGELLHHFTEIAGGCTSEVTALFEGPMRQLTLILNGPETAKCILDICAPGLSKRSGTWTEEGRSENGRADLRVGLELALRLAFGWINRHKKEGEVSLPPQNVSNSLHEGLTNSKATKNLLDNIKHQLMTPHYISMYQLESALWETINKRRRFSPGDGFHVAQYRIQCRLDPSLIIDTTDLRDRIVFTGTRDDFQPGTIGQYTDEHFHRCGGMVLRCLDEALRSAHAAGAPPYGSSTYDAGTYSAAEAGGLKTILVEVFEHSLQISIYARPLVLVEVLQNAAWLCSTLGEGEEHNFASLPDGSMRERRVGGPAIERAIEITDVGSEQEALFVEAKAVSQVFEARDSMNIAAGTKIARGFPPQVPPRDCEDTN